VRLQWIRSAFPWRTAALLAMIFGVPVLAFAAWFVWEIEPLQSCYLPAYRRCSKTAEQTGSTTEIRWLMKTAPGRASQPVIPSDVTTEWTGDLSIRLSSSALDNGWRGLEKSAPERGHSAELEDFLRSYIYDGVSYSNLIAFPLLEGSTMALMVVAFIAFTMRAELWQEWQRLWRQVMAGNSVTDNWWDSPPIRHGISQRIVITEPRIIGLHDRSKKEPSVVQKTAAWLDARDPCRCSRRLRPRQVRQHSGWQVPDP